jgi:integrase
MATKTRGKGEGSVFLDSRGLWNAVLELPPVDGKRRRKVLRGKNKDALMKRFRIEERELAERGDLPTSDQTVAQWMRYWFESIAVKDVRPKTAASWRGFVFNHIIPTIGTVRLSRLSAKHVREVTDRIVASGLKESTALTAHRIMSVSFEWAVRENRIARNPAKLVPAPRKNIPALEVLSREEAYDVFQHVLKDKEYGVRWAIALLTGARRGEVIGLEADRVTDVLDLSWQLQRLSWQHGCDPACGRYRAAQCPAKRLQVPADYEYRPVSGGLYLTRPKSRAGWRIIPLVEPLRGLLQAHMQANPPGEAGLIFTIGGKAIDPDRDSDLWRAVLADAGIKKRVRLHDLRHTAVDMLYLAGVPEDLIVQIVGHSSRAMTRAYASRGNIVRLTEAMTQMSELVTKRAPAHLDRSVESA